MDRSMMAFGAVVVGLVAMMAATWPCLVKHTKFGLEFRGGYEIQYLAEPLRPGGTVTRDELLGATRLLRQRADSIGMAEPEIALEGNNRIRLKIAGLTNADQARSLLGAAAGMPVRLTEKYTQTVGSVLGRGALRDTLFGGIVGFLLICVLLTSLYRLSGLVASLCLVAYLWCLALVFNAVNATLSLSAIVAFVLGIGMAADASIIWFERVLEEHRKGGSLVAALKDGFRMSFHTVCDANLATAIAMLALFVVGIGPIQGFSLTMLLSMVLSVGSSLFLVGWLCGRLAQGSRLPDVVLLRASRPRTSLPAARLDFVRWGRWLAVFSLMVMALGLWSFYRHGMNLDIDFTAGTALDLDVGVPITQETTELVMESSGVVPATIVIGGKDGGHIAARFDEILQPDELGAVVDAFKLKYGDKVVYEENTADPGVARDFARKAVFALLAACVGIVLFVGLRFSWAVAAATSLGFVHDLALVSAVFALFKLEIDVTYVAAMLTVMGYSLNDKIVIFSRVKENLRTAGSCSLRELVNRSVRQTLSRSIYTVLTVVLASASLLALGCEPLQMFSLAILLGLVFGACSSVFLSTGLWVAIRGATGGNRI